MFITFEGGEGSGKTTIIASLLEHFNPRYKVLVSREPGGSFIAENIRNLVLDPKHMGMSFHTEALLYAASRAQHLDDILIPAFSTHDVVLCDRYLDSSYAYQGYARNLGFDFVSSINQYALNYMPDLTFYIDVDPNVGMKRIQNRISLDRLDQEHMEFHNKVRQGYLEVAKLFPDRIIVIDGHQPIEDVIKTIIKSIEERLS
jgi:dTMP kinase